MKTAIVEGSITANDALEKNLLYTFLLNEQLVKAEKAHDVANENLLGSILLVFKSDRFEEIEQDILLPPLDLLTVEVTLFFQVYLAQK